MQASRSKTIRPPAYLFRYLAMSKSRGNKTTRTAPSSHQAPHKPSNFPILPDKQPSRPSVRTAPAPCRLGEGVFTDHRQNPQEQKPQKYEIVGKWLKKNIFQFIFIPRRQLPQRRWLDFLDESSKARRIGSQSIQAGLLWNTGEVSASSQQAITSHLHTQPAPHEGPVSRMSGKLLRPGHGWR